jgi:hypothetical protein
MKGTRMSVFNALEKATIERNAGAYIDLMADDCVFVRHQTGTTMTKAEMAPMLETMMAADGVQITDRRCVYENDDILVLHSVMDFPDGTREAVLSAYSLKDGKVVRLETGATPLAK